MSPRNLFLTSPACHHFFPSIAIQGLSAWEVLSTRTVYSPEASDPPLLIFFYFNLWKWICTKAQTLLYVRPEKKHFRHTHVSLVEDHLRWELPHSIVNTGHRLGLVWMRKFPPSPFSHLSVHPPTAPSTLILSLFDTCCHTFLASAAWTTAQLSPN